MMKPALLVIDVQKEFFYPASLQSLNDAIEYINAAVDLFREKQLPIVCIQHAAREYNLVPGQVGFDLPDDFKILPSDLHIQKTYPNSFNKTSLVEDLKNLGVDTVIVTGYSAEGCVLSTYRGAEDNDLVPIILRGSIASSRPNTVKLIEEISDVVSFKLLIKLLE